MDLFNELNYSFEEQCFINIDSLRRQLIAEENEDLLKSKRWQRHRLFKSNIFEDIDPLRKRYLEKILSHTLRSLGKRIRDTICENARKKSPSIRTLTPCRDLTESPFSSRTASINSPLHIIRSRSASIASDLFNPITEVIVISSDDEVSDDEDVKVKREPFSTTDDMYYARRSESRSDSGLDEFPDNTETQMREKLDQSNFLSNPLMIVIRSITANYMYDKTGVIHLKPKKHVRYSEMTQLRQPMFLFIISKIIKLIESDSYVTKRELYYLAKDFCKIRRVVRANNNNQTQSTSNTQLNQTQSSSSQNIHTQINSTQFNSTQSIRSQQCIGTQNNLTQDIQTQSGTSQGYGTQTNDSQRIQSQVGSQNNVVKYDSSKLDKTIDDLCCLLGCSRIHLRILTQSKGLVYGDLKFKLKNGEQYDCLSKKDGISLPTARLPIIDIESSAKFILVIEKDSVLQTILKHEDSVHFIRDYKVILFTAKGYPDVTSRAFLNYIWMKLKIPMLALTDADPHGLEIVCSYKFGCYATAYESIYLAVPQMKWLGLLPGDIRRLKLSESKTLPHSINDIKKLESLSKRPYLKARETWMLQLEMMKILKRKAELESLDKGGEYLVRTYLPNKLKYSSWL